MWWGEQANVYLSLAGCLLRLGRGSAQWLAGDSLERTLWALDAALPARRCKLRLHLAAALCPVMALHLPAGLHRFSDRQAWATAQAAQLLALPEEEVMVSLDPREHTLAAPLARAWWTQLREWASARGHRLLSAQPMWCEASRQLPTKATAFRLHEPDAITLCGRAAAHAPLRALTVPLTPGTSTAVVVNRLHQSLELPQEQTQVLVFATTPVQPAPSSARGPWRAHWRTHQVMP